MAFDPDTCRMLIAARAAGVSFQRTITLGRQWLMTDPALLKHHFQELTGDLSAEQRRLIETPPADGFADPVMRALGCPEPQSMDASDYEKATILHDLNLPICPDLHQKFDAVIDGGTLEHVFNFPVAIANAMNMADVGGRLFLFTPANNYMGHGFYQFSPELMYRVLSEDNGFVVERMLAKEMGGTRYFQVTDPDDLKRRVAVVNRRPLTLMVQAKRVAVVPLFRSAPQQSDYAESWAGNVEASRGPEHALRDRLRYITNTVIPPRSRMLLRRVVWEPIRGPLRHRELSLKNRRFFKPVSI